MGIGKSMMATCGARIISQVGVSNANSSRLPFLSQICYGLSVKWKVTFYNREVEAALLDMPAGLLARFIRYAERMEVFGPDLGMPHTRAMNKGLFELRIKASEGIGRVFYGALSGRNIVMLHHFVKKTRKTPGKELEIARRRLQEIRDGR